MGCLTDITMLGLELSLIEILAAVGIAALGSAIQGSIGIGLGFIAVPTLVLLNPGFVPGPLLLSALVLTTLMSIRERSSIHTVGIKWAIPGRLVGSIIGAWILSIIAQENISIFFGSMILLAVIISLAGFSLELNARNLLATGVLSGIMGTTSAVGGPPIAIVYQKQKGPRIRGTLSVIFVVGTIISIISLAVIGRFGWEEIKLAAVLIPGVLIGYMISHHTKKVLDRGFIRATVLILSALSGLVVILKTIL